MIIELRHKATKWLKYVIEQPTESPAGTRVEFSTSEMFVPGTLEVYRNGLFLLEGPGNDFVENADRRSFTFTTAPASGDIIQVKYMVD